MGNIVPTYSPIQRSLEVKRAELEADGFTRNSTEVKNEWSYSLTPPICHHVVHRYSCNILHLP